MTVTGSLCLRRQHACKQHALVAPLLPSFYHNTADAGEVGISFRSAAKSGAVCLPQRRNGLSGAAHPCVRAAAAGRPASSRRAASPRAPAGTAVSRRRQQDAGFARAGAPKPLPRSPRAPTRSGAGGWRHAIECPHTGSTVCCGLRQTSAAFMNTLCKNKMQSADGRSRTCGCASARLATAVTSPAGALAGGSAAHACVQDKGRCATVCRHETGDGAGGGGWGGVGGSRGAVHVCIPGGLRSDLRW